jgi:hypothetical protein
MRALRLACSLQQPTEKENPMLRKLAAPLLIALSLVACRAHARVGPVHAGGGISSR